jgi:hypothetical protein
MRVLSRDELRRTRLDLGDQVTEKPSTTKTAAGSALAQNLRSAASERGWTPASLDRSRITFRRPRRRESPRRFETGDDWRPYRTILQHTRSLVREPADSDCIERARECERAAAAVTNRSFRAQWLELARHGENWPSQQQVIRMRTPPKMPEWTVRANHFLPESAWRAASRARSRHAPAIAKRERRCSSDIVRAIRSHSFA